MPMVALNGNKAILYKCNGGNCDKEVTVYADDNDKAIAGKLLGWYVFTGTTPPLVYCAKCAVTKPSSFNLMPFSDFIPTWLYEAESDKEVHRYDDVSGGPPGNCQGCGNLIGEYDYYLVHSPNYPKVPKQFQRFPICRACWIGVMDRFVPNTAERYKERWRRGW